MMPGFVSNQIPRTSIACLSFAKIIVYLRYLFGLVTFEFFLKEIGFLVLTSLFEQGTIPVGPMAQCRGEWAGVGFRAS